jgi:uncharacterized protein (TIRG00374 family)
MKKKWLLIALLAALLVLVLWQLDLDNLWDSITQIPLWLVFALLALQIASQLLLNLQWCLAARFSNATLSFGKMLYINCQGAVVDSITPGVKVGGEVTRAVQISRIGDCSGEQAAAVVAMQKLFSLSAFFLINLFTVGFILRHVAALRSPVLQIGVYAILILCITLFACTFLVPHRMQARLQGEKQSRLKWTGRVRGFFLTLLGQVILMRGNKQAFVCLSALSVFVWLLYPAKMYLLLMHLPHAITVPQMTAIVFTAYMVAMIPVFPGGLVGFEGTMSGLLLMFGLALADAAVVTVVFRFFTFWLVMGMSLVFVVIYKTRLRVRMSIDGVCAYEQK